MIDPTPREVDAEARKILETLPSRRPQMLRVEARNPPSWDCTCWAESASGPCPMHPGAEFYDCSHLRSEAQGGLPERWLTTEQGFLLAGALASLCWLAVYHWAPQIAAFLHKFALTIGRM